MRTLSSVPVLLLAIIMGCSKEQAKIESPKATPQAEEKRVEAPKPPEASKVIPAEMTKDQAEKELRLVNIKTLDLVEVGVQGNATQYNGESGEIKYMAHTYEVPLTDFNRTAEAMAVGVNMATKLFVDYGAKHLGNHIFDLSSIPPALTDASHKYVKIAVGRMGNKSGMIQIYALTPEAAEKAYQKLLRSNSF